MTDPNTTPAKLLQGAYCYVTEAMYAQKAIERGPRDGGLYAASPPSQWPVAPGLWKPNYEHPEEMLLQGMKLASAAYEALTGQKLMVAVQGEIRKAGENNGDRTNPAD